MTGTAKLVAFILALATLGTHARAEPQFELDGGVLLPAGFQYPNGIAAASDGSLYVGSVTSGTILKISPAGEISPFFTGSEDVFAGTALRLDEKRGLLWGASPDFLGQRQPDGGMTRRPHRIFALDIATVEVKKVILIPDGGFGNDLAIDDHGGVYVTDSARDRVLYLPPDADAFRVHVENPALGSNGEGLARIGAAGIALSPDGKTLVVGVYGAGRLVRIEGSGDTAHLRDIPVARPLENPDGFVFLADGSLLLTEGAAASGAGKVLLIPDVLADTPGPRAVSVLADGLDMPVNLTLSPDGRRAFITESGLGHRFRAGGDPATPPQHFRVLPLATHVPVSSSP